jgi:hypothetical protein
MTTLYLAMDAICRALSTSGVVRWVGMPDPAPPPQPVDHGQRRHRPKAERSRGPGRDRGSIASHGGDRARSEVDVDRPDPLSAGEGRARPSTRPERREPEGTPGPGHLPGHLPTGPRHGRQDLHDVPVPDDEGLYEGERVSGVLGQSR